MNAHNLNLLVKHARAIVIQRHLKAAGLPNKVVCFTCGNSAKFLREEKVEVIEIGRLGMLHPCKWFTLSDIQKHFNLFDATSGHLPMPLMQQTAEFITNKQGRPLFFHSTEHGSAVAMLNNANSYNEKVTLPTGSGETLVILKMAFPDIKFVAEYNEGPETEFNDDAPLNNLVKLLAHEIIM